jgi:hypothetical protein
MINVNELLWIPVNKWKPGALDLNHYAVTFLKSMGYIRQCIFN